MNEYIELMERTLSAWRREYPVEWIEQAYKNTVGEPTTQERQAESGKFDTAFQDGYDHGYAQARFDYEQEPRKGHWISRWYAGHDFHFHVCSECNEEFSCDMETGISIDNYRYCPNCGAKMVEPESEGI